MILLIILEDGKNITPQDLYAWSDEHGQTPKTAAPSVEDIEQFLDKDSADEYIVFPISSSMSASFNNCRLAAEDLEMSDRVHVIDSANLSTGIGLQVLYAAELSGSVLFDKLRRCAACISFKHCIKMLII